LTVSEPFGYFGNRVQRFGGVIKEKDFETVGKGLIDGSCHFLEMHFQYMKISLTRGIAQVKRKIFTKCFKGGIDLPERAFGRNESPILSDRLS
jgi:hypothetical protein